MKRISILSVVLMVTAGGLALIKPAQAQTLESFSTVQSQTSIYPTTIYPTVNPHSGSISQPSSVVIINTPNPVIVIPQTTVKATQRPLWSPRNHYNRNIVIINAPARQCGTAIIGSPIPSPIPVDITGRPCN